MPRGRDSLDIVIDDGSTITIDYNWHRYEEHHSYGSTTAVERFLDWDYEAIYHNGKQISAQEARRLYPDWESRADAKIKDRH